MTNPKHQSRRRRIGRIARWAVLAAALALLAAWALGLGWFGRRDWKNNPLAGGLPATGPARDQVESGNEKGKGGERPTADGEGEEAELRGDLLAGVWAGQWASNGGVLRGELHADIRRVDADTYEATFVATAVGALTQTNLVRLTVRRAGPRWEFSGRKDLGLLRGGVYQYEGHCDGREFWCTYDSSLDSGLFRMQPRTRTTTPAAPAPTTGPAATTLPAASR
jgi:hypothetical protein